MKTSKNIVRSGGVPVPYVSKITKVADFVFFFISFISLSVMSLVNTTEFRTIDNYNVFHTFPQIRIIVFSDD